jgi:translation initiation factor IF-3
LTEWGSLGKMTLDHTEPSRSGSASHPEARLKGFVAGSACSSRGISPHCRVNCQGGNTPIFKDLRINDEIRAREVRLVGDGGEQLGIVSLRDALAMAQERHVDLVEVSPTARPPVCRLMDYGKFKYEQAKRDRESRKKQKVVSIKELKMRPGIDDHDFDVKVRSAQRFLAEGDKVKCTMVFRGREIVHASLAQETMKKLAELTSDVGVIERVPRVEGRAMIMILAPKKGA